MESSIIPWSPTPDPAASMIGVIDFTQSSSNTLPSIEPEAGRSQKRVKKSQAQRRLEEIDKLLEEELDDGTDQPLFISKAALDDEELLTLTRIYLDYQDQRGDGFWTAVTAEFARQTRRKHGSLQRVYKTLCEKWKAIFEEQGSGTGEEKDSALGRSVKQCLAVDKKIQDGITARKRHAQRRDEEARDAINLRRNMMESLKRKHRSPSVTSVTSGEESIDETEDEGIATQAEDSGIISPLASSVVSPSPSISRASSKSSTSATKRKGRRGLSKNQSTKEPWQARLVDIMETSYLARNNSITTLESKLESKLESANINQDTKLTNFHDNIRDELGSLAVSLNARIDQLGALLLSRLPPPSNNYAQFDQRDHGVGGGVGGRSDGQYGL